MSLRDQFIPDANEIFIDLGEFAQTREFRIADGHGGFRLFLAKVGWFDEDAKQLPIVKIQGVYQGDVMLYIEHRFLPRMPVAGELIYSPANKPWEVLDITDEEGIYKIALYGTRSQPAKYGSN